MPQSTRLQLQQVSIIPRKQLLRWKQPRTVWLWNFVRQGSSSDWKTRNEGRRIPISCLREKCCRLTALGDGYRHQNASCRLDLVGGRYQSCVSCLKNQWTCGNSLRTWKSRRLGCDSKFGAKGDAMDNNQRSAIGIPSRTSPGF